MHGPTASNVVSDAPHGDLPVFCGPTTRPRRLTNIGAPAGRDGMNFASRVTRQNLTVHHNCQPSCTNGSPIDQPSATLQCASIQSAARNPSVGKSTTHSSATGNNLHPVTRRLARLTLPRLLSGTLSNL